MSKFREVGWGQGENNASGHPTTVLEGEVGNKTAKTQRADGAAWVVSDIQNY